MPTRKKVTDLWTVTRNGPDPTNCGHAKCTFGSTDSVAASHKLRDEGERPTGYTEAMAAAVARRGRPHGARRAISVAHVDRNVHDFHLKIKGSIYIGNPMEIKPNPEKSDRPVDSHEEWAGSIPMVVTQHTHSALLTPSRPLARSATRANDPLGIPRRWRGPLLAPGAHTAPGAPSLSLMSIGM